MTFSSHQQQDQSKPLFKPTLILHGGAGNIERSRLPPELYERYRSSLLTYLRSTSNLLNGRGEAGGKSDPDSGCSALDGAVHAVSLMEDDELFNCGRGSVFTTAGTIEMEASVMVSSVVEVTGSTPEITKRGSGVMMVKNVRHPIKLAGEVLLRNGKGDDADSGGSMHCQLAGPYVESLARDWGLEFKPDEWFWTKKRWDEHRRGLEGSSGKGEAQIDHDSGTTCETNLLNSEERDYLSQGTVGCVCLDRWGNLAVATSTGGLTNKFPGRIGDTPTLGAGFWAESWNEVRGSGQQTNDSYFDAVLKALPVGRPYLSQRNEKHQCDSSKVRRRAVALSGTGNGDSFLRLAAARTTAAMCRFSQSPLNPLVSTHISLADAIGAVAGPGGELQRSAGPRWGETGEGTGGIIGIEATAGDDTHVCDHGGSGDVANSHHIAYKSDKLLRGHVVFDFNCGGMFRAWIEEGEDGSDIERMMVFKEEYR